MANASVDTYPTQPAGLATWAEHPAMDIGADPAGLEGRPDEAEDNGQQPHPGELLAEENVLFEHPLFEHPKGVWAQPG